MYTGLHSPTHIAHISADADNGADKTAHVRAHPHPLSVQTPFFPSRIYPKFKKTPRISYFPDVHGTFMSRRKAHVFACSNFVYLHFWSLPDKWNIEDISGPLSL